MRNMEFPNDQSASEEIERIRWSKPALISFILGIYPFAIYPFAIYLLPDNWWRVLTIICLLLPFTACAGLITGIIGLRDVKRHDLQGFLYAQVGIAFAIWWCLLSAVLLLWGTGDGMD